MKKFHFIFLGIIPIFLFPFFVFAQPVASTCYDFAPTFGNTGSTVNVSVKNGAQNKIWPVVNQNPPSLLQPITFLARLGSNGQPVCPLVSGYKADVFFVVNGKRIPTAISPFLLHDASTGLPVSNPSYLNPFWYNGLSDVGGNTLQEKINNENAIIDWVDQNHSITFDAIMYGQPAVYQRMTAPVSNCAKLSGTGSKKIVFIRSSSWNSTVDDFIFQANATRDRFLTTEPFKSYANQFSFYTELKKDSISCGSSDIFEYVILASHPENPSIGISSGKSNIVNIITVNVAKADLSNITSANSIPHAVLRETGRIVAGLQEEQYTTGTSGTVNPPITTCTTDPFKDFRDSATNYIYGAIDQTGCMYEKDKLSTRPYLRPTVQSIMNTVPPAQVANPPADSEKFNIISCGYLISAIKGEALTKENALKNWTACWKMDLAKEGVPPLVPAPKISDLVQWFEESQPNPNLILRSLNKKIAIVPGSDVEISGSGFTLVGNSVQFVDSNDSTKVYEITNIPTSDKPAVLSFTIPATIPVGSYEIKVGALNSAWSNGISKNIHGSSPSNLVARAIRKGRVNLSWLDNSSDETSFVIHRFSGNPSDVSKVIAKSFSSEKIFLSGAGIFGLANIEDLYGVEIASFAVDENATSFEDEGLEPSKQYTYVIRARFDDNFFYSLNSNIVTVTTLPKPKAPIVTATALSDSVTSITWPVDKDIASYSISEVVDKVNFKSLITKINNHENTQAEIDGVLKILDDIPINGNEKEIGLFQAGYDPNTEHCYVVRAVVNTSPNMSDMSDMVCATTLEEGGVLSLSGGGNLSSISGTATFNFDPSNSSNISSIQLVADNGTVIATDRSDPYGFSFDSSVLTNGSHSLYVIMYTPPTVPGGANNSTKSKPISIVVNNPKTPGTLISNLKLNSISPNSISSNCQVSGCDVITLTGTGFDLANNTVHFVPKAGGTETTVSNVGTIDVTRLALSVPTITDGVYDVFVENAGGGKSNSLTLTIGENPILNALNIILPGRVTLGQTVAFSVLDPSILTNNNVVKVVNDQGVVVQTVTPTLNPVTGVLNFTFNPSNSTEGYFTVTLNNSDQIGIRYSKSATACADGTSPANGLCLDGSKDPAFAGGILDPIVPCDGVQIPGGTTIRECDFNMLIVLAKNIINFLLISSTAIAASCFFFAGYLYLTAGGNVGQITRAHHIFKNVAIGLIIALSAWLIVNTILTAIIPNDILKNYNLLGTQT